MKTETIQQMVIFLMKIMKKTMKITKILSQWYHFSAKKKYTKQMATFLMKIQKILSKWLHFC